MCFWVSAMGSESAARKPAAAIFAGHGKIAFVTLHAACVCIVRVGADFNAGMRQVRDTERKAG